MELVSGEPEPEYVSVFWNTYIIKASHTNLLKLTIAFYSQIWEDFWLHPGSMTKLDISELLIKEFTTHQDYYEKCNILGWKDASAKIISKWLGLSEEFFVEFPWDWMGLEPTVYDKICRNNDQMRSRPALSWMKNKHNIRLPMSDLIRKIEQDAMIAINSHRKSDFDTKRLLITEEGLNDYEKFTLRTIQMKLEFYTNKEIPVSYVAHRAGKLISTLEDNHDTWTEDYVFAVKVISDDNKESQWESLMRYKGFVGELIFAEVYPQSDISNSDRSRLGPVFTLNPVSETNKKTIKQIIEEAVDTIGLSEPIMPSRIPYHFPDFYIINDDDSGIVSITLFEVSWAKGGEVKKAQDSAKWNKFIKEFNNLNRRDIEFDGFGYNKIPQIYLLLTDVDSLKCQTVMKSTVRYRMSFVKEMIGKFLQGSFSLDNPNLKKTVEACQQLTFPRSLPQIFNVTKSVVDRLEKEVNDEVFKETGFENYVKHLETPLTELEVVMKEAEMVEWIENKVTDEFVKSQTKWVQTSPENLAEGVKHINDNLFDGERLMRMVENNHHDSTQFDNLDIGTDLREEAQSFFNAISDLMEIMVGKKLAKLNPTLCIMVHISAGHETWLANNRQFGWCKGFNLKTSRVSGVCRALEHLRPTDARVDAIMELKEKGTRGHPVWKTGDHSLSRYRLSVDTCLAQLAEKKDFNDYVYRFTNDSNCTLITEDNIELVMKQCCEHQSIRFEHGSNDLRIACPRCNTRYRVSDPLAGLRQHVQGNFLRGSWNDVSGFLQKYLLEEINIFERGQIVHLLSSMLKGNKLVSLIGSQKPVCHQLHLREIYLTLSKRQLTKSEVSGLVKAGVEFPKRKINDDSLIAAAQNITDNWYMKNLKYLRDALSADKLKLEIDGLVKTNPMSVCLAEFAEDMMKIRSQHFALHNACGYVCFSRCFGPVFSAQATPDAESIKCFTKSPGHMFINHRTLRMIQGLPAMLISNKLILDKLIGRNCDVGDYSGDGLVKFCLLNSRRLNANLQNVRYFFMACWSVVHCRNLYKKLEMDFLKVSELKTCLEIIKYMKNVCKNAVWQKMSKEERQEVSDNSGKDFKILFNEQIRTDLNNVDLCLHSFYEVHLFEKTIAGRQQEILKVFKKFLNPKLKLEKDKSEYMSKFHEHKEKWFKDNRHSALSRRDMKFLRSDGVLPGIKDNLEICFKDMLDHANDYAGFSADFIKCAAFRYNGFNLNQWSTEIRQPNSISELLKSTSTVKKFDFNVNFNKMCDAADLKTKVEFLMKDLKTDMVKEIMKINDKRDDTFFPEIMKVMKEIKVKPPVDLDENTERAVRDLIRGVNLDNVSTVTITAIDQLLSTTPFPNICANFELLIHETKSSPDDQSELMDKLSSLCPVMHSILVENTWLPFLFYCDSLKMPVDEVLECWKLTSLTESYIEPDFSRCLMISACYNHRKDEMSHVIHGYKVFRKDRTPRNMQMKARLGRMVAHFGNPRDMTTQLINDILKLIGTEAFSDTYAVCNHFGFNSDPIVFGIAFKEQFGGERELTISDIQGKLTLKLIEDVARHISKCMSSSCLNAPKNEVDFKHSVTSTQKKNNQIDRIDEDYDSSGYIYGSMDHSKWGPFHVGMSFYSVLCTLITKHGTDDLDVLQLVKYAALKHAKKHFEIHHNVAFYVLRKCMKIGILVKNNRSWSIDDGRVIRPDIKLEPWERSILTRLNNGEKSVHTRMDMGQGMLHSCSDVYGTTVDYYINWLCSNKIFSKSKPFVQTMNTSDDSASIMSFAIGPDETLSRDQLVAKFVIISDILKRMGNIYLSEKSVFSDKVSEFKSSFMSGGYERRVLVKFVSSQLMVSKDAFPEDYWNSYNSLVKQILCNGGSQMMCDLLWLTKLHSMSSVYSLGKSPFEDCILDAPPSRFGFPNLLAPDVYYHTSKYMLADRAMRFLSLCGYVGDVLKVQGETISEPGRPTATSSDESDSGANLTSVITKTHSIIQSKSILPDSVSTVSGATILWKESDTPSDSKYEIVLRGSKVPFYVWTSKRLSCSDFRESLVKFYCLPRGPGLNDSETICAGIDTLLPSQKGKLRDKEVYDLERTDLNYLDYFMMTKMPNTVISSKLRSAQALRQSLREAPKKSHPNMVYAKGLHIDKGNFSFFRGRSVSLATAMCNFDNDDEKYKSNFNLLQKMVCDFDAVRTAVYNCISHATTIEMDMRGTNHNHETRKVPMTFNSDSNLEHSPLYVRARLRSVEKYDEPLNSYDVYIMRHTTCDPATIESDMVKFKRFYGRFTSEELMVIDRSDEKETMQGVYMFKQMDSVTDQIETIIKGCLHNNIIRNIGTYTRLTVERNIDLTSIQKILLSTAIFTTNTPDMQTMRKRIIKFMNSDAKLKSALVEGMKDTAYALMCSVIQLFISPRDENANQYLRNHFKAVKGMEESGTVLQKTVRSSYKGVNFVCIKKYDDEHNIILKVSPCNTSMRNEVERIVRSVMNYYTETFHTSIDSTLIESPLSNMFDEKDFTITYNKGKFVINIQSQRKEAEVDFFMENTDDVSQRKKWSNCVEVACTSLLIKETRVLWNLINDDTKLKKAILEADYSELTTEDYDLQYQKLEEIMSHTGSSSSEVSRAYESYPFSFQVVRDYYEKNPTRFHSLCPDSVQLKSSPFVQILLLSRLMARATDYEDIFSLNNFLRVLPDHTRSVNETVPIYYDGLHVTHLAKITGKEWMSRKLSNFNERDGVSEMSGKIDFTSQFGMLSQDKGLIVFGKDVSVSNLWKFRKGTRNYISLIDVEQGEMIVWDMENGTDATRCYDEIVRKNWSYRYAMITNLDEVSVKLDI